MKRILNGEVFFVLFLLSGYYKVAFEEVFIVDPTALFFALSFLSALSKLYKRRFINKELITPLVLYLGFLLLMVVSLYFVGNNSYSFDKTMKFATVTAWSFLGIFFLTDFKQPLISLRRYLWTILAVGFAMVLDVFFGKGTDQIGFITALGSNYIALGRMVGMSALIILAYLIINKHTRINNIILLMFSLLFIYVMLLSGGQMPVMSFLVCLFLLIISTIKITGFDLANVKVKKRTLRFGILIVLSLPFAIYYLSKQDLTFVNRFSTLFSDTGGNSTVSRMIHYERAWGMFIDTKLLGSGIGNYIKGLVADISYPHNIFLEIAAELGVFGLMLFTVLILLGVKRFFGNFSLGQEFYSTTVFLLFIFSFLAANVAGDINDNRFMFFTLSLLSLSKIFKRGLKEESLRVDNTVIENKHQPKRKFRTA